MRKAQRKTMNKLLFILCIPLLLFGAAPKKITVVPKLDLEKAQKIYTEYIISYASLQALQAKVNEFIKKNNIVVVQITWQSVSKPGCEQHQAIITFKKNV